MELMFGTQGGGTRAADAAPRPAHAARSVAELQPRVHDVSQNPGVVYYNL